MKFYIVYFKSSKFFKIINVFNLSYWFFYHINELLNSTSAKTYSCCFTLYNLVYYVHIWSNVTYCCVIITPVSLTTLYTVPVSVPISHTLESLRSCLGITASFCLTWLWDVVISLTDSLPKAGLCSTRPEHQ